MTYLRHDYDGARWFAAWRALMRRGLTSEEAISALHQQRTTTFPINQP